MESEIKVNLHTHTMRCRHASGTDRDYIETALRVGMTTLGFSDHAPYTFPREHLSFRMFPEQIGEYVSSLSALRDEYKGRIDIKIGYEMEFYPRFFTETLDRITEYEVDYLILGQHHLNSEVDGVGVNDPTTDEAVLAQYVDQIIAGMETGIFTYVAHPDTLAFEGDLGVYQKHYRRLIGRGIELGIPFEMNMQRLCQPKKIMPEEFFRLCGEMGASVCIGCDAHSVKNLICTHAYSAALGMIDKYRLDFIESPKLRKVHTVQI